MTNFLRCSVMWILPPQPCFWKHDFATQYSLKIASSILDNINSVSFRFIFRLTEFHPNLFIDPIPEVNISGLFANPVDRTILQFNLTLDCILSLVSLIILHQYFHKNMNPTPNHSNPFVDQFPEVQWCYVDLSLTTLLLKTWLRNSVFLQIASSILDNINSVFLLSFFNSSKLSIDPIPQVLHPGFLPRFCFSLTFRVCPNPVSWPKSQCAVTILQINCFLDFFLGCAFH